MAFAALALTGVPTYSVHLKRLDTATGEYSIAAGSREGLTSAGAYSFNAVATAGLYKMSVTVQADNGVSSDAAVSSPLLLGMPSTPSLSGSIVPGVGTVTLKWLQPGTNPDPSGVVDTTRYTLRVYSSPGGALTRTLELTGYSGDGLAAATAYTKVVTLLAGEPACLLACLLTHCSADFPRRAACRPAGCLLI